MDALRSVLPAGTLSRRAEGPRDADHRRARAGQARRLRRRGRLALLHRRPRHLHLHPHGRGQGRRRARPGRRRHRRRRQARLRVRGVARQGARRRCARSSSRASRRTGRDREGPRRRQLRLVHLQPRPVPGRAGGGARGRAQRPRRASTSCSSARLRPRRRLARPVHAQRGRHLASRSMRRFPEAGVPTLGVCLGHQSLAQAFGGTRRSATCPCTARRPRSSTTAARSSPGLPSPLTVGRYHSLVVDADAARLLRGHRPRRRRPDGDAPPRAARRGRPVPPRVGAHRRRASACWRTSSACARCPTTSSPRRSTRSPRGQDLPREQTAAVLAEIMAGNASEAQTAGVPDRAAHEGRDGRRARRPGAHDARARRRRCRAAATT